jgi:hypothetical protein
MRIETCYTHLAISKIIPHIPVPKWSLKKCPLDQESKANIYSILWIWHHMTECSHSIYSIYSTKNRRPTSLEHSVFDLRFHQSAWRPPGSCATSVSWSEAWPGWMAWSENLGKTMETTRIPKIPQFGFPLFGQSPIKKTWHGWGRTIFPPWF